MFKRLLKNIWYYLNPNDLEGIVKFNIDKKAWKHATTILIAVLFIMPVWAVLDYYCAPTICFDFLYYRLWLSIVLLVVFFVSRHFKQNSTFFVHICFLGMSAQAAYLVTFVGLEVVSHYFMAFATLFVAINMLVLWKPINSAIQQLFAFLLFLCFYAYNSSYSFIELLTNGGLMLATLSTISILLVRTRYNFERKEIKARAVIDISNEQLLLQSKMIGQQKLEIEKKNNSIIEQNNALILSKSKAEEASKSKAEFLATMSHEIRTPLNGVIGLTHLLLEDDPKQEQIENLNALKFSAQNLHAVVNDILDFSKIEQGKIELEEIEFRLYEVVKAIIAALSYRAKEKQIELNLNYDENVPSLIIGDPTRLGQVLNNLLNNAIKFTDKGSVSLNIRLLNTIAAQAQIEFEVKDTGIGIPKAKQKMIFDRFTQSSTSTARKYGGTGLGLSICKNLLALKGTELLLESDEGKGAKFYFSLNYKHKSSSTENIQPHSTLKSEPANNAILKILVAEDNLLNQKIIAKFLAKWNMKYTLVENGLDALDRLNSSDYNLILMDLQMPKMDGLETTQSIRKSSKLKVRNIPIIALTASAMLDVEADIKLAGMNDYISKPFNPDDLYHKIMLLTNLNSSSIAVKAS